MRPRGALAKTRYTLLAVGLAAVYYWTVQGTHFAVGELVQGWPAMADLFRRMWPPDWSYTPKVYRPMLETLQMALAGTSLGALLAVPATLLAARNIARNPAVLYVARTLLNLVRTLPDMLLAAVFVAALGIGATPGVMALAVFSFGIIAKLSSESVEAIDPGPLEALEASGAGRLQTIAFAVVPQVLPQFVAYCLYVFEINIRVATVLGLVGAGGIGVLLLTAMTLFRYREAMVVIMITFVFVVVLDTFSTWLRERLI